MRTPEGNEDERILRRGGRGDGANESSLPEDESGRGERGDPAAERTGEPRDGGLLPLRPALSSRPTRWSASPITPCTTPSCRSAPSSVSAPAHGGNVRTGNKRVGVGSRLAVVPAWRHAGHGGGRGGGGGR